MLANYFKKRPLSSKNKKRGFAVSGMLYPLLILMLFLVVQILFMMQTRKNVLDKSQKELSDTVNTSNTIYNNEELSTLIQEQAKMINDQKLTIDNLNKKLVAVESSVNKTNDKLTYRNGQLTVKKIMYGKFIETYDKYIVLKLGDIKINSHAMILATLKTYTYVGYNTINVGAYMYDDKGVFAPGASYLNKTNPIPLFFGVRKSDGNIFIIADRSSFSPYFSLYIDEIAISYISNPLGLESGWDMYSTNDLSAFTISSCAIL